MGSLELWFSNWKWSVKVRKPPWWHLRLSPPMNGGQKTLRLMSRTSFMRTAALQTIWLLIPGKSAMTMSVASLVWLGPYHLHGDIRVNTGGWNVKTPLRAMWACQRGLSNLLKLYVCLIWTWSRNICIVRQYTTYPYSHSHQISN